MNKSNLAQWYRRNTASDAGLPDADTLAALAGGERMPGRDDALAQVAASPRNGDLLRFACDLQPLSEQLSTDLADAFGAVQPARSRAPRPRHALRRWSVPAALAASLIVAFGIWHAHRITPAAPPAAAAAGTPVPDRIFAGLNDRPVVGSATARGDEIFRGGFRPDEIFNSGRHDG